MPPATPGARPHVHGAHDEDFSVLTGQLTLATDVVLGSGDLAADLLADLRSRYDTESH